MRSELRARKPVLIPLAFRLSFPFRCAGSTRLLLESHRHGGGREVKGEDERKKKEKESTADAGSLPRACLNPDLEFLLPVSRSLALSLAGVWFLRVRAGPGSPHGIKDFGLG